MLKAIREAKAHTSWINQNTGVRGRRDARFVRQLLSSTDRNLFLDDFLVFQRRIAPLGYLNGLSQTLIKLTSPGVPDIYQGTELFDLSLVDPDNRRPVDYSARQQALEGLQALGQSAGKARVKAVRELLDSLEDGRAKLYLTWQTLLLRRHYPEWISAGDYVPLNVSGLRSDHLCTYARVYREQALIVVAPRWFSRLVATADSNLPLGPTVWGDTCVELPVSSSHDYINVLTGEPVHTEVREGKHYAVVGDMLANFPVALVTPKLISL